MSTWTLPLANRAYTVSDILNEMNSNNLEYDDDGNPEIRIVQPIENVAIDQSLRLDGAQLDLMDSVGVLEIDPPPDIESVANLGDIVPVEYSYVPPISFDIILPVQRLDNFSWAQVEHGLMNLAFHNNLEIDLDTFAVTVIDSMDYHVIGTLVCENGLSYLETETEQLDISGQTVSNSIFMSIHAHTPGGVLINAGPQALDCNLSFPGIITVSAARARIREFTRSQSGLYEIEDSTRIYSAVIDSGTLNLHILNRSEMPFDVHLHSSNFRLNNSDFSVSRILQPHDSSDVAIDLTGYVFIPDDTHPNQSVTVDMFNTVNDSSSQEYTFRSSDSLIVHANISEISFETLDGRIRPIAVNINPVTRELELPDGMNRTRLPNASLGLTISNNSMIPAMANMTVSGGGRDVHFRGTVSGKTLPDDPPAVTHLIPNQEELAAFFDPPPENMLISGQGIINPDYAVVSVRENDNFSGELVFQTALSFVIGDTVDIRPDVSQIPLDSRPDGIGDRFSFGSFEATLVNTLPVGVLLRFYVGYRSDSTLLSDPATAILGPYYLASARTDSNGFVLDPVISDISDSLDTRTLDMLQSDSLFFGEQVQLLPTPPSGVTLISTDNIHVAAGATVEMLVGGD